MIENDSILFMEIAYSKFIVRLQKKREGKIAMEYFEKL